MVLWGYRLQFGLGDLSVRFTPARLSRFLCITFSVPSRVQPSKNQNTIHKTIISLLIYPHFLEFPLYME